MFNLFSTIKSLFSSQSSEITSEYNFESMGLKRGRGSDFWSDEKVARLLDLLEKGYTYEQVGQALQATRGQLATKVRQLRQLGISIKGTSKTKTSTYSKSSNPISRKSKKVSKQEIDSIISQVK